MKNKSQLSCPCPALPCQQPSNGQPPPQDRRELPASGPATWGRGRLQRLVRTDPTSSWVTALWGCCSGHAQFRAQQVMSHHIRALPCPSRCCPAYAASGGRWAQSELWCPQRRKASPGSRLSVLPMVNPALGARKEGTLAASIPRLARLSC